MKEKVIINGVEYTRENARRIRELAEEFLAGDNSPEANRLRQNIENSTKLLFGEPEGGVLVRGMKMPKDCPYCPLAHWNRLGELTGCGVMWRYVPDTEAEYWTSTTRPPWCPLVEVPRRPRYDAELLKDCGMEE